MMGHERQWIRQTVLFLNCAGLVRKGVSNIQDGAFGEELMAESQSSILDVWEGSEHASVIYLLISLH